MSPERAAQWREAFNAYGNEYECERTAELVMASALSMLARGRYSTADGNLGFIWRLAPGRMAAWQRVHLDYDWDKGVELLQELALNAHKVFPPAEESAGTPDNTDIED